MFGNLIGQLQNLRNASSDNFQQQLVDTLASILAQCQAAFEHRGPVTFDYTPPTIASGDPANDPHSSLPFALHAINRGEPQINSDGTVNNGLAMLVTGSQFNDGDLWVNDNLTVNNNLTVNGGLTLDSLTVNNDASIGGDLTVTGVTNLGDDIILYDLTNDGNPEIRVGSADAEEFHMQAVYDAGGQTLNYVLFSTDTASGTADKGKFRFDVDGTEIFNIVDNGVTVTGTTNTTDLTVTNDATIQNDLTVNNNATIDNDLTVVNDVTVNNNSDFDGTINVDGTSTFGDDIFIYNTVNDGNPVIVLGSSATENLTIRANYDAGTQNLSNVTFTTNTASATGDAGQYTFNVDGTNILNIDDGGITVTGETNTTNLTVTNDGTIQNDLTVNNNLQVDVDGTIGNDLTVQNDLTVNNNTDLDGTLNVDGTSTFGDDITLYDTTVDGSPIITIGSGAGDELHLTAFYEAGTTILDRLELRTQTTSASADAGRIPIYVDDVLIMTIDDGGIEMNDKSITTILDLDVDGDADFSDADSMTLIHTAAPTISSDGHFAIDSSVANYADGIPTYYSGQQMAIPAMPWSAWIAPTNGWVMAWSAALQRLEWVANGGNHDLLSATHGDTTAAAVVRGDLIVGQTATPKWQRKALGANTFFIYSDATDLQWGNIGTFANDTTPAVTDYLMKWNGSIHEKVQIKNMPYFGLPSGTGAMEWRSKTMTYTDFSTAATSNEVDTTINLDNGETIQQAFLELTTYFDDAGSNSWTLNIGLDTGQGGSGSEFLGSYDVSAAVAAGLYYHPLAGANAIGSLVAAHAENSSTNYNITADVLGSVNLDNLTQGEFTIHFLIGKAP